MDYEALCSYEAEHLSSAHDHRPSDKGRGGGGGGELEHARKENVTPVCVKFACKLSLSPAMNS